MESKGPRLDTAQAGGLVRGRGYRSGRATDTTIKDGLINSTYARMKPLSPTHFSLGTFPSIGACNTTQHILRDYIHGGFLTFIYKYKHLECIFYCVDLREGCHTEYANTS